MIRVEHLDKNFENLKVLKDISVEIEKGDIVAIIGPSGSGKSTFLRCINRLEEPSAGHIFIDEEDLMDENVDINQIRAKVGMVFQHFNLFPHMTVLENLTLAPIQIKNIPQKEAEEKAKLLLNKVGLLDKASSYPNQLSGGQKQRVAIASAIASDRTILILDEPTSGLDFKNMKEVSNEMIRLKEDGKTIFIITHDPELVDCCCDYFMFMENGKVKWHGIKDEKNMGKIREFFDQT